MEANARALANQLVATQDELVVLRTAHEQSAIELVSPAESKAMEATLTPVTRPRTVSTPDARDVRVNLNNYRLEALDVAAPQYTSSQVLTMLGEADSLVLDDDTRHDIRLLRDQAAALMRLEQDMARLLSTSAETYSSDDKQRHPSQRVVATMQQQLLILRDLVAVGSVSMISAVQQLGTVVTSLMTTFKRRYLAQMRENAALLSQLQKVRHCALLPQGAGVTCCACNRRPKATLSCSCAFGPCWARKLHGAKLLPPQARQNTIRCWMWSVIMIWHFMISGSAPGGPSRSIE